MDNQLHKQERKHTLNESFKKSLLLLFQKFLDSPLDRMLTIKQTQYWNYQFSVSPTIKDSQKQHHDLKQNSGKIEPKSAQQHLKTEYFTKSSDIAKSIYREQGGWKSFFRGYPAIPRCALGLFLSNNMEVTNGLMLFKYLSFIGFTEHNQYATFLLVTMYSQIGLSLLTYPFHQIQVILNKDIGGTQKQRQFISFNDAANRFPKFKSLKNVEANIVQLYYRGYSAFLLTTILFYHTNLYMNGFILKKYQHFYKQKQEIGVDLQKDSRVQQMKVLSQYMLLASQVVATFVAYPFELVYRVQIAKLSDAISNNNNSQKDPFKISIRATIKEIMNTKMGKDQRTGYRNLYNGVGLAVARNMVFLWFMPDALYSLMNRRKKE
eukprot:403349701